MKTYLIKSDYIPLYILIAVVYISGLWIPLMENDSAQHATMAMRMYLDNDFLNIIKGGQDYLDKPHMHFWLAALSFKLFGISQWSYRIPALLFTLLGAFSANRLAKELYGNQASHIASLVFLSAQAVILSNHDVRTDAVLTGATIFGIWQFVLYINFGVEEAMQLLLVVCNELLIQLLVHHGVYQRVCENLIFLVVNYVLERIQMRAD